MTYEYFTHIPAPPPGNYCTVPKSFSLLPSPSTIQLAKNLSVSWPVPDNSISCKSLNQLASPRTVELVSQSINWP